MLSNKLLVLAAILASCAAPGCATGGYDAVRADTVRGAVIGIKLAQCTDAAITEWQQGNAQAAVEAVRTSALTRATTPAALVAAPAPVAPAAVAQ